MTNYRVGTYRPLSGYIRQRLNRRNMQGLSAIGNIDDELWTILEYYSEVESVGLELLRSAGISHATIRRKIFRNFKAHVRQAKNYYYSAKILPIKSAGLLYYYCFLNLAKAAILLKDPSLAGKFINHGLLYKMTNNSSFETQTVSLKRNGVFEKLYEWYFGVPVKIKSFNIKILLGYCTDIGYQARLANISNGRVIPAYYASVVDKPRLKNWALVGFYNANELLKYKRSIKPFIDLFEKINVPEPTVREIFNISAYQSSDVTFFQSRNERDWISSTIPDILTVRDETIQAFEAFFQTNYFKEDVDFKLSLPYRINMQERMDELIAIYIIMYYLSNLVRYKPAYLENLLDKKEAWIIESFVRTCSQTFLKMMVSRITGTDYVLEAR